MSVDFMIRRFIAIWGNPKVEEPNLFIAEYRRCLDGFSDAALERATDRAIDTSKFWPRPAEVRELAVAASAFLAGLHKSSRHPDEHNPIEPPQPLSEEAKQRAMAMVETLRRTAAALDLKEVIERRPPMDRPTFEQMQECSPNVELHSDTRPGPPTRSRAMAGERS
jgi:hypothetical protein